MPNWIRSKPAIPFIPLVLALLLAAACDADRPSTRMSMSVLVTTFDTINGVVHVANTGTAPAWDLDFLTSIGPDEIAGLEAQPDEFGRVSSAALGPGNEVYIADSYNAEIRVFGLDGGYLRTLGRHGEGPGEFAGITSVAWVGDRLFAMDLIGGRINEFSAEGEVVGQRQAPGRWGGSEALRLYAVASDEAWSIDGDVGEDGISLLFIGQTSAGETGDTLRLREDPWDQSITCEYNDGWWSFFENRYSPKLAQHPGPGGTMYLSVTDAYRIAITRGADTLRIIERDLTAEPVTDQEWEAANEDFYNFMTDTPRADCTPAQPERPALKPFIRNFFIAPDSRIWVEVMRTEGDRWEVFDPEGRLLGTAPLHPWKDHTVPAFAPDHMITIVQDSVELDHVQVWGIERGESE